MVVENYLSTDLSDEEMLIQTCVAPGDEGHQQPKDHSAYLNFITVYMLCLSALFMLCFKTEMKRTNADEDSRERAKIVNGSSSKDAETAFEEAQSFVQQPALSNGNE